MCELQKFDGRNDKGNRNKSSVSVLSKALHHSKRWMRNIFHIKQRVIPRYLYFELLVSLFFLILGLLNTVLFIAVGCDKSITGILIISHICLIIINMIFFSIMSWVFKRE